jgi:hypothetical protein
MVAAEESEKDVRPQRGAGSRARRELVLLGVALLLGLLVVPAMIHYVGLQVFGPGEDSASLAAFLGRYLSGLGAMNKIVWLLVLSPYLLLIWLRLVRLPLRKRPADTPTPSESVL